jgi:hypothetical protein
MLNQWTFWWVIWRRKCELTLKCREYWMSSFHAVWICPTVHWSLSYKHFLILSIFRWYWIYYLLQLRSDLTFKPVILAFFKEEFSAYWYERNQIIAWIEYVTIHVFYTLYIIQKMNAWASAIQGKKLSGERIANLEKMSECPALRLLKAPDKKLFGLLSVRVQIE